MADFHQSGVVPTFHRLGEFRLERIEQELKEFNRHRPIALVLPVTPAELDSVALKGILHHLKDVDYLNEIVVVLGRTEKEEDFLRTKKMFSILPQRHRVIWASGPQPGRACIRYWKKRTCRQGVMARGARPGWLMATFCRGKRAGS